MIEVNGVDESNRSYNCTGFDWDLILNQLEEEAVYNDEPEPIISLIDSIKEILPEFCAADEEDQFGNLPRYRVCFSTAQFALINEIMEVNE